MALYIKDPEAERLAAEVAELTGESKTAAIRNALRERRDRLAAEKDEGAKNAVRISCVSCVKKSGRRFLNPSEVSRR